MVNDISTLLTDGAGCLKIKPSSFMKYFLDHMDVSGIQEFLRQLNEHLANYSYINGFLPTQADSYIYRLLSTQIPTPQNLPYVLRWYKHIQSFKQVEQDKFPKQLDWTSVSLMKLVEVGI